MEITEQPELHTIEEISAYFKITPEHAKVMARKDSWPCVRLSQRVRLFTDDHVAEIRALYERTPEQSESADGTEARATTGRQWARSTRAAS